MCTAIIKRRRACPCGTYTCTGRSTDLDPIWHQPLIWRDDFDPWLTRELLFRAREGSLSRPVVVDVDKKDILLGCSFYLKSCAGTLRLQSM